jgi:hypothetical protein
MKVLIVGEIIGKPGREKVKETLPSLLSKYKPDFVIANGEHLAGGKGLTPEKVKAMNDIGIDFFTTGNHAFSHAEINGMLDDIKGPVVRPANYPDGVVGKEYKILEKNGKKILIINLMGRTFFREELDDPYRKFDEIYKKEKADFIIVDFHAEATSEKVFASHYLDGRASIVFGSHTHVPTSDLQILPKGTFYVTDIGMVGPKDSVIGMDIKVSEDRILKQILTRYKVADFGPSYFNAIFVELADSGKAVEFEKIEKIV